MAKAFHLPSSGFAAVSPTPTGWNHTNTVSRPMHDTPSGTPRVQLNYSPDPQGAFGVPHPVFAYSMCCQFVSDIKPATKLPPQHIYLGVSARDLFNATVDVLFLASKVYAVSTDGATVVGSILPLAHEPSGQLFSNSARGATQVGLLPSELDLSADDWRLVLEVGAAGGPGPTLDGGFHNVGITFGDPVYTHEHRFVRNDHAQAADMMAMLLFTNGLGSLGSAAPKTRAWAS